MVLLAHFSARERRIGDEGLLRNNGYGFSYLNARYEVYDRSLFIDTLDDWGWADKARPAPDWYSGAPS